MRVFSRIALVVFCIAVFSAPAMLGQPNVAGCPLTLTAQNAPATDFYKSPHGIYRFGSQVFELRGQTLTTYAVTDLGDMQVAREDFVGSMAARESNGGTAFSNGFLFVSSEAGLEIFDLRGVRPGGSPPLLVSRTPGVHYRRLAVFGNMLAALFPATDMPCFVNGSLTCFSVIDIYNISNLSAPVRVGAIDSRIPSFVTSFNDIAFNFGILIATGFNGTIAYNIANPAAAMIVTTVDTPGTFLVSNGTNLIGIGSDRQILTYTVTQPGTGAIFFMQPLTLHTIAPIDFDIANPLVYHPQAFIDDQNLHLITMIDELNPQTLKPARTIAFDVFDYNVFMYEGSLPRVYEQISYIPTNDEVKFNPIAVGPVVYVVGELSGLQTYGACGQMTGRIDFSGIVGLACGGAELHGWVTGALKITNVEIFLDGGSLGSANLTGPPRFDVPSTTPVTPWKIAVNLDQTTKGEHLIRAVGTDASGNRRQFASVRVLFPGPGSNCVTRRRSAGNR
jgi:hypothetical protein